MTKPTSDLGQMLSIDTIPSLIMERMSDIRNLATEIRTLKIFADPASREDCQAAIESLTFKAQDHPLIQIIKQTAHMYYECKSDAVKRELLSELRALLAEQHTRELEAMREANKNLVEWARIRNRKGGNSSTTEDDLMKLIGISTAKELPISVG